MLAVLDFQTLKGVVFVGAVLRKETDGSMAKIHESWTLFSGYFGGGKTPPNISLIINKQLTVTIGFRIPPVLGTWNEMFSWHFKRSQVLSFVVGGKNLRLPPAFRFQLDGRWGFLEPKWGPKFGPCFGWGFFSSKTEVSWVPACSPLGCKLMFMITAKVPNFRCQKKLVLNSWVPQKKQG